MTKNKPSARKTDIVSQTSSDGGSLLYDLKRNRAFHLNDVSTQILNRCDGRHTIDEIAADLSTSPQIVKVALVDLVRERLVEEDLEIPKSGRREMLRQLAAAGFVAALPMLTTVIAPSAVRAQSAGCFPLSNNANENPNGCACDSNNDCTSTCCGVDGTEVCVADRLNAAWRSVPWQLRVRGCRNMPILPGPATSLPDRRLSTTTIIKRFEKIGFILGETNDAFVVRFFLLSVENPPRNSLPFPKTSPNRHNRLDNPSMIQSKNETIL
jgi:hypothetical protein